MSEVLASTKQAIATFMSERGPDYTLADAARETETDYHALYDIMNGLPVSIKRENPVRGSFGLTLREDVERKRVLIDESTQQVVSKPGHGKRRYKKRIAADVEDDEYETFFKNIQATGGYNSLLEFLRGEGWLN